MSGRRGRACVYTPPLYKSICFTTHRCNEITYFIFSRTKFPFSLSLSSSCFCAHKRANNYKLSALASNLIVCDASQKVSFKNISLKNPGVCARKIIAKWSCYNVRLSIFKRKKKKKPTVMIITDDEMNHQDVSTKWFIVKYQFFFIIVTITRRGKTCGLK